MTNSDFLKQIIKYLEVLNSIKASLTVMLFVVFLFLSSLNYYSTLQLSLKQPYIAEVIIFLSSFACASFVIGSLHNLIKWSHGFIKKHLEKRKALREKEKKEQIFKDESLKVIESNRQTIKRALPYLKGDIQNLLFRMLTETGLKEIKVTNGKIRTSHFDFLDISEIIAHQVITPLFNFNHKDTLYELNKDYEAVIFDHFKCLYNKCLDDFKNTFQDDASKLLSALKNKDNSLDIEEDSLLELLNYRMLAIEKGQESINRRLFKFKQEENSISITIDRMLPSILNGVEHVCDENTKFTFHIPNKKAA